MKTIIASIILFFALSAKSQSGVQTVTFVVKGNCEDCKERIENAADIKGVKICKWDPDTKITTLTYNADKTTLLKVQEAIAAKGYDAAGVKGNDVAYNKLPKCCQYRHGVCEEPKK